MYCGVPLGAALAASIGIVDLVGGWQVVFYVGGVVPLLIVPLLGFYLSESAVFRSIKDTAPGGVVQGLFRQGAALPNAMIMGHLLL
jgi:AAHS family 3-hydroxyphenylpropionic acid transporter